MILMKKKLLFIAMGLMLTACGNDSSSTDATGENTSSNNDKNTAVTCNKGIPSNLPEFKNKGLLTEPVYYINTEKLSATDEVSVYQYESNLLNGVLNETVIPIDNKNISVEDTNYISRRTNFISVNSQGVFTHYDFSKTAQGYPIGYVSALTDDSVTMSIFNDQCDLSADNTDYNYTKISVAGLPIKSILELDSDHSSDSIKGYKYIRDGLVNQIVANSVSNPDLQKKYQAFQNSSETFPEGSYIYVPTSVILHDTTYYFTPDITTSYYKTFAEMEQNYNEIVTGQWLQKTIGDIEIDYHVDINGIIDDIDPSIKYQGIIYDGEKDIAGEQMVGYWASSGDNAFMNKTANDAVVAALKNYYFKP